MIEYLKDKWLTWYTGQSTENRLWRNWAEENIVYSSSTIENMFMNFKYIIPVTTQIFNEDEPFGWVPNKKFQQYMYPSRKLGDNAVYYFARGERSPWDGHFHFNEFGSDQVFVATNNERDAIMIALLWK